MSEKETDLLDIQPGQMLEQIQNSSISTWSDSRRKDFSDTFKKRAKAARAILIMTGDNIMKQAIDKQFCAHRHWQDIPTSVSRNYEFDNPRDYSERKIGGRSAESLATIANERAAIVLKELPSLKKAVEIIDPETAKRIDKRDELQKKGNALFNELKTLSEKIDLGELDQNMTIGEFRDWTKKRNTQRTKLINQLNEISEEGKELERLINKKLYRGLPGLAESVVKVVVAHYERAEALDQLTRRVTELVMFGDSKEAMSLLESFEKDEIGVSESVKIEFQQAMQALKDSIKTNNKAKKSVKQLNG